MKKIVFFLFLLTTCIFVFIGYNNYKNYPTISHYIYYNEIFRNNTLSYMDCYLNFSNLFDKYIRDNISIYINKFINFLSWITVNTTIPQCNFLQNYHTLFAIFLMVSIFLHIFYHYKCKITSCNIYEKSILYFFIIIIIVILTSSILKNIYISEYDFTKKIHIIDKIFVFSEISFILFYLFYKPFIYTTTYHQYGSPQNIEK